MSVRERKGPEVLAIMVQGAHPATCGMRRQLPGKRCRYELPTCGFKACQKPHVRF
jgi:hypothetical protein